jgi:CRISPR-associated protein Cas2
MRHCNSSEITEVHKKNKKLITAFWKMSVLRITGKQYGNILNYWSKVVVNK